jgi:5-methyltetrahydrofolate--homocysteine methyltransferase
VRSKAVGLDIDSPRRGSANDPSAIEQGLTPQTATPVVTWTFPRQKSLRRLCLADFFRPLSENKFDVFPMQAVTMGEIASE